MKGNIIKTSKGKYRVIDSILSWKRIKSPYYNESSLLAQETIYLCVELETNNTKVVGINPKDIKKIY